MQRCCQLPATDGSGTVWTELRNMSGLLGRHHRSQQDSGRASAEAREAVQTAQGDQPEVETEQVHSDAEESLISGPHCDRKWNRNGSGEDQAN